MKLLVLGTILGLGLAATVASMLGGALGAGVLGGFLFGAGISGLGALYLRHALLHKPDQFMVAFGVSFGFKLLGLLLGGLSFRFLEPLAERADWRSFLVAYGVAVIVVLPLGTLDAVAVLRRRPVLARAESRGHA